MFCFSDIVGVKSIVVVLLWILLLQGCYYEEISTELSFVNPIGEQDCGSDTICTKSHQRIVVDLICENGEHPSTRGFKAYFTETEEITNNLDLINGEFLGIPIVDDSYLDKIDFNGTSITLEITVSKFKTWKREFIVARDCCNVFSPEGQELEFTL